MCEGNIPAKGVSMQKTFLVMQPTKLFWSDYLSGELCGQTKLFWSPKKKYAKQRSRQPYPLVVGAHDELVDAIQEIREIGS